jgi:hypothetical protein
MFNFGIQVSWELYGMNTKNNLLANFGIDPPFSAEVSEICWLSEVKWLNSWMVMTCHIYSVCAKHVVQCSNEACHMMQP